MPYRFLYRAILYALCDNSYQCSSLEASTQLAVGGFYIAVLFRQMDALFPVGLL